MNPRSPCRPLQDSDQGGQDDTCLRVNLLTVNVLVVRIVLHDGPDRRCLATRLERRGASRGVKPCRCRRRGGRTVRGLSSVLRIKKETGRYPVRQTDSQTDRCCLCAFSCNASCFKQELLSDSKQTWLWLSIQLMRSSEELESDYVFLAGLVFQDFLCFLQREGNKTKDSLHFATCNLSADVEIRDLLNWKSSFWYNQCIKFDPKPPDTTTVVMSPPCSYSVVFANSDISDWTQRLKWAEQECLISHNVLLQQYMPKKRRLW